jgi:hypothetical protein
VLESLLAIVMSRSVCLLALAAVAGVSTGVAVGGAERRGGAVMRSPPPAVVPIANITLSCDMTQWGPHSPTYCVATTAAEYLTL